MPSPTPQEDATRLGFHAMLQAMSRPGVVTGFVPAPCDTTTSLAHAGEVLLDLEVTYYTPDLALGETLSRTGARPVEASQAEYLFFSRIDHAALDDIASAPRGNMLEPERGATLLIACGLGGGTAKRITGPGIRGSSTVHPDVPEAFWIMRERLVRFPLGWDVLFVDAGQMLGLPRTARVETGG